MPAKLRHIALVSDQYALLGKFYEAAFGMHTAADTRPERAVTVSDGYVGLNINPRKPGRPAGLDHFGLEVEDAELVLARLREKYPAIRAVRRPATRPFAGISTHDPAGNVFDLSQQGMTNRTSVYVEGAARQARYISHLALRTLHAETLAQFYSEVYELERLAAKPGDRNFYLSDGRVTLVLIPWDIADFQGTGIVRPGPDHIGFTVESVPALQERLRELSGINAHLRAQTLEGREGEARLKLFAAGCPYGRYHLADLDGVLIDVSEAQ